MRPAVDRVDEPLLAALRGSVPVDSTSARNVLARAEVHGLTGVVYPLLRRPLDVGLAREVELREIAHELEHGAHLALLHSLDSALARARLQVAALKGALLAERFYAAPALRSASDIDLLVAESELDAAIQALTAVGYLASDSPSEARFRREHHHLHLSRDGGLPIELHFHAYRGFGSTLRSEPLLARSGLLGGFESIRVLDGPDELVYLAVHAAGHRLGRIGWLYDLKLVAERLTADEIVTAATRARELKFSKAVAFMADLLVELLGVDAARLAPLRKHRSRIARVCMREPKADAARSFSRFVYSTALCDAPASRASYVRSAVGQYVRRLAESK